MNLRHPLLLFLATTAIVRADDLQPLGDEFNDAASIAQWLDIQQVEGWQTDQLEQWNINTTTPGMMRVTPRTSSWYNHLRGALVFKNVSGDFVCTTRLRIRSRHNPGNADEVPNRMFTLAGIFAHVPRGANYRGAPLPYTSAEFAQQGGAPVWPYPGSGSTWQPFTENYLFLSFGAADQAGVRKYEVKATRNSNSLLYYNNIGYAGALPNTAAYTWVELQMVRVGARVVVLRRHPDGVGGWGAWIVENRYPNSYQNQFPLTGPDVQLGITTYTDWESISGSYFLGNGTQLDQLRQWRQNYTTLQTGPNAYAGQPAHAPDLITDVEYFRLERPNAAVTVAALDALPTTFVNQGSQSLQLLPANGAGAFLGDAANTPLGSVAFASVTFLTNETAGTATIAVTRTGASTDKALTLHYETLADTAGAADFTSASGTLSWAANDTASKSFIVAVANDGLAEGPETLTVRLSQLNGPATFAASAPAISTTLTILDAPLDQWRLDRFGAQANTPQGQPGGDFDRDGADNFAEFVLGGNPTQPDAESILPKATPNGGKLTLRFIPAANSASVRLIVQATDNLTGAWSPLAHREPAPSAWTLDNPAAAVVVAPETGEVTVTDAVPILGNPIRFLRLRAELP